MQLENIQKGLLLTGVLGDEVVTVTNAEWFGSDVVNLTYRTAAGRVYSELLHRNDEARVAVHKSSKPWTFSGNGADFRLVSEAQRIKLAHLFDPHLAVHASDVEPLPHQITAVYESMLPRQPLRFLLADDPGAGKTIMAGLLIRELMMRGDVERCLIVCPGILDEQWQDELVQRFHLNFELLTNDKLDASGRRNWFAETDLVIARLDTLARNEEMKGMLKAPGAEWDLIVCDEAHKMSATYTGGEIKYTKRYRLGELLSGLTRHFLLMTATPHSGKETDFQLFMALIDRDRFEGRFRDGVHTDDPKDMMRRMVKERLVKFDGKPLFPERIAHTVPYQLSEPEARLYDAVTEYVREEFNRADSLGNDKRKGTVGFALTLLQRRLASSPDAIYHSLRRRRERLEHRLEEQQQLQLESPAILRTRSGGLDAESLEDLHDGPQDEFESAQARILDEATAAQSIAELKTEIRTLARLEQQAGKVRHSGTDTKWGELVGVLDEILAGTFDGRSGDGLAGVDPGGGESRPKKHKLVIFTEHVDTLTYLERRMRTRIGRSDAVVVIHGRVARNERQRRQEEFTNNPDVQILLATDAAGEGINLQRAHLMVNYDLPWNPNRLEQRFGRIHRIGQTEVCRLWNLVAKHTREGDVYVRLLMKLEQARKSLSGQVFDVVGKLEFEGRPLRQLLLEAIRYGEQPEVRQRLVTAVDQAFDSDKIRKLLEDEKLVTDVLKSHGLQKVRLEMQRAQARRLQPHFIESFFDEAFKRFSGSMRPREEQRYEVKYIPAPIRNWNRRKGSGKPLPTRYERITFEKEGITLSGRPTAEFICPGHPLLDSVIDLTLHRYQGLLKQGAILVDEADLGTVPRVVVCIEHTLQSGVVLRSGERQIVSKRVLFVELGQDDVKWQLRYAPYLDFRPLGEEDPSAVDILNRAECQWIGRELERVAESYAVGVIAPEHLEEVREVRRKHTDKTKAAVETRLSREINFWDYRAEQLKLDEAAGKKAAKMRWTEARRKADELSDRLHRRLHELNLESQISSQMPVVQGGFLVVPMGLIHTMKADPMVRPTDTQKSAAAARRAVMKVERSLGFEPVDREFEKVGYDIESTRNGEVRFIEVKGRRSDAPDIQVTRNEILFSLNNPEQYILAIVRFSDEEEPEIHYRRHPFKIKPDFGVTSVRYSLKELLDGAQDPFSLAGKSSIG